MPYASGPAYGSLLSDVCTVIRSVSSGLHEITTFGTLAKLDYINKLLAGILVLSVSVEVSIIDHHTPISLRNLVRSEHTMQSRDLTKRLYKVSGYLYNY